jgi:hypothetical protein
MTLGAALTDLNHEVEAFRQEMAVLHTAILVDRPTSDDVVLIDLLGDAALDALDLLNHTLACAVESQQSANSGRDLAHSAQALAECSDQMMRLSEHLSDQLLNVDRLMELLAYSKPRGGEWRSWSLSVKDTLLRCSPRFIAAQRALLACWQEMAEFARRE